jgi:hypothetical protein
MFFPLPDSWSYQESKAKQQLWLLEGEAGELLKPRSSGLWYTMLIRYLHYGQHQYGNQPGVGTSRWLVPINEVLPVDNHYTPA